MTLIFLKWGRRGDLGKDEYHLTWRSVKILVTVVSITRMNQQISEYGSLF